MSSGSSSTAGWSSLLEPAPPPVERVRRPDDPRLGEIIEPWRGDLEALRPGRAVLIGYPQDEGVRRNHGRPGAAEAPAAIREHLYRLPAADPVADIDLTALPPLDAGNLGIRGSLEDSQLALAQVAAGVLERGALPIVLGGGHETAYGHFLAYVSRTLQVGIINIDAHLDVRPWEDSLGHSGAPFRQALEHPTQPLAGPRYVCLGAQPHGVSQAHLRYSRDRGCVIRWADEVRGGLAEALRIEAERLQHLGSAVYVSLDADVVRQADVPGVSAPNPIGLAGREVIQTVRLAGQLPAVTSFDLVEINPRHDRDGQSVRWAALAVWHFLLGLARRPR